MIEFKRYQDQLMGVANAKYKNKQKLSDRVVRAFYATPRHQFVDKYQNHGNENWIEVIEVNESNLDQHLGTMYTGNSLAH